MSEEMTKKPYRSCRYLESVISFQSHQIVFCCDRKPPATIKPMADAGKTVDAFFAVRGGVIRSNQSDNPPCEGCNLFREYEPGDGTINYIQFGVVNYCNFSCTYCELQHGNAQYKNKPETYDEIEVAEELKRRGLISHPLIVAVAPGEITIHPRKDRYYDFAEENAQCVHFVTNAGKFDQRLAHILTLSPLNGMTVSIDAGTEETFRKIRGVNMFKQVVANLMEYRKYSPYIFPKYILMEGNCGDEDLEGFIKICEDLNIPQIKLSADSRKTYDSWTSGKKLDYEEDIVSAAMKLVKGAIRINTRFTFEDFFGRANLQEIYRRVAELPEAISAVQQLDTILSAPKLVCYGAGGNCKFVLDEMAGLGLRKPDVIWDIKAQPGQKFCVGEDEYPVCRPDFDALNGGEYGVFSTIVDHGTNKKLASDMEEHGYPDLLIHARMALALTAKRAGRPI